MNFFPFCFPFVNCKMNAGLEEKCGQSSCGSEFISLRLSHLQKIPLFIPNSHKNAKKQNMYVFI